MSEKVQEPKKGEQLYSFPEHGVTVYATDMESALKQLKTVLKGEVSND